VATKKVKSHRQKKWSLLCRNEKNESLRSGEKSARQKAQNENDSSKLFGNEGRSVMNIKELLKQLFSLLFTFLFTALIGKYPTFPLDQALFVNLMLWVIALTGLINGGRILFVKLKKAIQWHNSIAE